MRVTFVRLPDHSWGYAMVERDDGVTYMLRGGPVTSALPHDLVHLNVEDALGIADGIWGAIAGGVVFRSMVHQSGRRPPHAAERSAALIRAFRDRLGRAELLGGLVERIAELTAPSAAPAGDAPATADRPATPDRTATAGRRPTRDAIARLIAESLSTRPHEVAVADQAALEGAAAALHAMAARWQALAVGERLTVEWPAWRCITAGPRRPALTAGQAQAVIAGRRRRRATASSRTSSRLQNAKRMR